MSDSTLENVRDYYGRVLETSDDLRTSACCPDKAPPPHLQALLGNVHPAVHERFYGCGSPLPPALQACTVLDLGCGSGRDAFVLSQLVGESGRVIGVDMTDEQLAVASAHRQWHAERFGHATSNVDFRHGYIEDLSAAGIEDDSIDVVISNCVINLSPDKARVFAEIVRVLKPGGELYFSDVFAGRRVPSRLRDDPIMLGECLGGALYVGDFRRLMDRAGIRDTRVVERRSLTVDDPELRDRAGDIDFHSMTIRAFNIDLEDAQEDYGQTARYLGSIAEHPDRFVLDERHAFDTGRSVPVSGNTADMLQSSRLAPHFSVEGDRGEHRGPFSDAAGAAARPQPRCC